MLHISIGYICGDYLDCDKCNKCKYRPRTNKLHNLSVDMHRFFEYRLHIKLPHLIYIGQKWEKLSGTKKCPFNKSRNYNCYDCKYSGGPLLRNCSCEERNNTPYEERPIVENEWGRQCAYFEKCKWADDFKDQKLTSGVEVYYVKID